MRTGIPQVCIVDAPPLKGVPFPGEEFDPLQLTDPEEFRKCLDAQRVARLLLPCTDTRAAHWRYYLFAAPPSGSGHPIVVRRRLGEVLAQNPKQAAGIGRRDHARLHGYGRRSHDRFLKLIESRFKTAYGSATEAFWGTAERPEHYPGPPSATLSAAARTYILDERFADFFLEASGPDQLRRMFRARLIRFRPHLASLIISKGYRLERAAAAAASRAKLDDDDRLLFFSWAVLQAYYGIADDGSDPDQDDADGQDGEHASDDQYYRTLAQASLDLLDRLERPGHLTPKQQATIRNRLRATLRRRGRYQPPVKVWKLTRQGKQRRVFASLRLYAFARLLRATRVAGG